MKIKTTILTLSLIGLHIGFCQSFVNLNFENANVSGYSPGSMDVPMINAFQGWNAYLISSTFGTNQQSQAWYDVMSTGGPGISINDTNTTFSSTAPILGQFSAVLFGGGNNPLFTAQISQTGLVPDGAVSLLVDANYYGAAFVITLGGQTINMTALQVFPKYTLYGGDISSFAGQVSTLSFLEPPAAISQPSQLLLDDIRFSSSPIPEPGTLALGVLGATLLSFRRRSFAR